MGAPTAVFLDRDGTIIRDVSYLSRSEDVELLPGAASAISRLNALGTPVIVITNQSGIARGQFTVSDYLRTQLHLDELLSAAHARIDATYYCPDHPDFSGPCACRKPGTELFERAAREHSLDMTHPAYVGDRWRDVQPSQILGGTPILINGSATPAADVASARSNGARVVGSLAEAIDALLGAQSG